MRGGRECRTFFFRQAAEFTKWHSSELPDSQYTAEEEEAGFRRFNEAFNFYATLQILTKGDLTRQDSVLRMSVQEVYTNIRFRAWQNYHTREYEKIMKEKREREARAK